ncbi:hypothetical protein [Paenibacillus xylanexedens]|uniref:hypothetical protein n=1 Tax=Paenibacillus xylanexedens TaxID=528191 RepID=UPI000F54297A|nr:hypothetical protein [Paenibacillus xylanexedens]RPK31821.1 hypothetical protein EDO6_02448 [Paenibacillus xylanexedens]
MEKLFELKWMDGTKNIISGESIEKAFNKSGFGSGTIPALDFYREIAELPDEMKSFEYKEDNGELSEITNPVFIEQIKSQKPSIGDIVRIFYANLAFTYELEEITKHSYRFGKQVIVK